MRNTLILLVLFAAILGPSAVISCAAIKARGRKPSSAPKILTAVIVALVFAEAVSVIALVVLFQLFSR
ncbi:MAG: hypothetical protein V1882_12815 [Candidatus Omnitrophota bacterium]